MAWEWVPVATAGVVFSIPAGGTLLGARMRHLHAERLANRRLQHERGPGCRCTRQQRLPEAYVELLDVVVEGVGHWSAVLDRMMDTDPSRELPPQPSLERHVRAQAMLKLIDLRAWSCQVAEVISGEVEPGVQPWPRFARETKVWA